MTCGDCFLFPAPGTGNTHLWVIITEPDPSCIIVSLTTLRNNQDQTVILRLGDHPFIKHETAVFYGDAQIINSDILAERLAAGMATRDQSCPTETLKLIEQGVSASPFTARKIKMYYLARKS